MAIATGPTKAVFLKTVKALVLAEYGGKLGINRHFQLNIDSNEVGDISLGTMYATVVILTMR